MTLQQMEYIVALDKYRHFALAAEACNVTQPTLSAMVLKLENELDVKIFDRSRHPLVPTAIGEKIISQAQNALNEAQRVLEIVEDEAKTLHGELKLGVIPTIAPYVVPAFIGRFKSDYPDIRFRISEMRAKPILEQIRNGNLDMAIVSTPLEQPDMYEVPIYYEPFVAYFAPNDPNKDSPLAAENMPTQHLWVLQEGHCVRKQVFNFCGSNHSENSIYEAGSIDTLVKIVDKNGGYTVIPEMHKAFLSAEQLNNVRPLGTPPPVREISIIIRKDYLRERMVNAVADTVKKIIPAEMINEQRKKFAIRLK